MLLAAPSARALLGKAMLCIDQQNLPAAENALAGALAIAPDDAECTRVLGTLLLRKGLVADAINAFSRALSARPEDALTILNLAVAQAAAGQLAQAIDSLRRACEIEPDMPELWFERAKLASSKLGDMEEARMAFARFLELEPSHHLARVGLADCLKALGRIEESAAEYRRVIAAEPRMFQAWFSLVDMKTVGLGKQELTQLEQLAETTDLPAIGKSSLLFALGNTYETMERYDDAFTAIERANAVMQGSTRWDGPQFSRGIDSLMAVFADNLPSAPNALGKEAIFVVSLPRSGSTLVEQVLAAHPEVEAASELPDLPAVINEESKRRGLGFPSWVKSATAADWERLGNRYLERTARWRQTLPKSTDKLPSNWLMVGAVRAMLPGARVMAVRRDPLETCWSCYKQLFQPGRADYTYSVDDLAAYWRDAERLTAFWQRRYPDRVRLQSYEALVAAPEAQIRELLDFCGLPFDPACLEPHLAARSTRTASAAQVRQPIRPGTARGARYGALLDSLRRALSIDDAGTA